MSITQAQGPERLSSPLVTGRDVLLVFCGISALYRGVQAGADLRRAPAAPGAPNARRRRHRLTLPQPQPAHTAWPCRRQRRSGQPARALPFPVARRGPGNGGRSPAARQGPTGVPRRAAATAAAQAGLVQGARIVGARSGFAMANAPAALALALPSINVPLPSIKYQNYIPHCCKPRYWHYAVGHILLIPCRPSSLTGLAHHCPPSRLVLPLPIATFPSMVAAAVTLLLHSCDSPSAPL